MTNILSFSYIIFVFVSLFLYYSVPKKTQWLLLLAANAVFYFFSGPLNFIFILVTSLITFSGAAAVAKFNLSVKEKKSVLSKEDFKKFKETVKTKKRLVLSAVIIITIGILAYLKYWNTIVNFLSSSTGRNLSFLIFTGNKHLILPFGISFYTFQSIAYFMDVYNSKYERERNFARYMLFISFFPQLMMGPINRYDKLGVQFKEAKKFDIENIKHGVLLILFGAMKKYCIADMLVNRISAVLDQDYANLPGCLALFGVLAYSIYQYADFSGGIDIMLGISKLYGIDMQQNFRQPYFSTSLADFWRRWHISLGLWMKDYVFFPFALLKGMQNLGKFCAAKFNKHLARTIPAGIANIVVFLLVGIWHGPELHFVVWGLFNGLVIAGSDLFKPAFEKINTLLHINDKSSGWHVFRIIRTFIIVNIGAYFDRIVDVPKSFLYLKRTFTDFGNPLLWTKDYLKDIFGSFRYAESEITLIFTGCLIIFITSVIKEKGNDLYACISKKNIVIRWLCYYVPLLMVVVSLSFAPDNPVFMYAQY